MSWCHVIEYLVIAVIIVQVIRLIVADADLTLLWKEKFGAKRDILKGKVVWITGASAGLGEYLAYDLARAGCRLVLSARREEELHRVKHQCLTQGNIKEDDIFVIPLDLRNFDTHKDLTAKVLAKFEKIDILVNNGGRSQRAAAHKTDLEVDKQIMELNYLGTLSMTKAVLPGMMDRKQGHIVVTSSLSGKFGAPFSASYSGTKFAIQGWFDTLRLEVLFHNINVTTICPGPVVSSVVQNAFTEQPGQPLITKEDSFMKKMSTERCAELMTIAIANKLDEVWISQQPVLGITYMTQYMPDFARWFAKKIGAKKALALRRDTRSTEHSE